MFVCESQLDDTSRNEHSLAPLTVIPYYSGNSWSVRLCACARLLRACVCVFKVPSNDGERIVQCLLNCWGKRRDELANSHILISPHGNRVTNRHFNLSRSLNCIQLGTGSIQETSSLPNGHGDIVWSSFDFLL